MRRSVSRAIQKEAVRQARLEMARAGVEAVAAQGRSAGITGSGGTLTLYGLVGVTTLGEGFAVAPAE